MWSFADPDKAWLLLLDLRCLVGLHNSLREQVLHGRARKDFGGRQSQTRPRVCLDGLNQHQLIVPESVFWFLRLASARRLVSMLEHLFALALAKTLWVVFPSDQG